MQNLDISISKSKKKEKKFVYKKKLRSDEKRSVWISRIFIWIMIIITLFPIVAVISASMAKGNSFTQTTFFPKEWTFENYIKVIEKTNFLLWVRNSLIISTLVATIQLILSVPAAFAFSTISFSSSVSDKPKLVKSIQSR